MLGRWGDGSRDLHVTRPWAAHAEELLCPARASRWGPVHITCSERDPRLPKATPVPLRSCPMRKYVLQEPPSRAPTPPLSRRPTARDIVHPYLRDICPYGGPIPPLLLIIWGISSSGNAQPDLSHIVLETFQGQNIPLFNCPSSCDLANNGLGGDKTGRNLNSH